MSVIPAVIFIIYAVLRKSKKNASLFIASGIAVIICTLGIIGNEVLFNRTVLDLSRFRDNAVTYALMLIYLVIIILTLIGIIRFKKGRGYKALMIVGASFGFVIAAAFSVLNVMYIINILPGYHGLGMLLMILSDIIRETALVFFYISFIFAIIMSSNKKEVEEKTNSQTAEAALIEQAQSNSAKTPQKVRVKIKKK